MSPVASATDGSVSDIDPTPAGASAQWVLWKVAEWRLRGGLPVLTIGSRHVATKIERYVCSAVGIDVRVSFNARVR